MLMQTNFILKCFKFETVVQLKIFKTKIKMLNVTDATVNKCTLLYDNTTLIFKLYYLCTIRHNTL